MLEPFEPFSGECLATLGARPRAVRCSHFLVGWDDPIFDEEDNLPTRRFEEAMKWD
jgi:hypothetical protein